MPGDTLFILNNGDTLRVADSVRQYHAARTVSAEKGGERPGVPDPFFLVTGLLAAFFILRPLAAWLWKRYHQKKVREAAKEELDANHTKFDSWLTAYNSYYRDIPRPLRQRFLQRVVEFMETKKFDYIGIAPDEKMPLLISAAAIQLTFGLDKYTLDFFDTIHVLRRDYRYGLYNVPFEGHVSSDGIYLSWDSFLKGYADYTDANNVGVHEMAHALAYVNFMAGPNDGIDHAFQKRFTDFSKVARPVFDGMRNGGNNVLGSYAATSYNEFWAVSAEYFFEQSLRMKVELPELYQAICRLLNQDPLLPEKILETKQFESS